MNVLSPSTKSNYTVLSISVVYHASQVVNLRCTLALLLTLSVQCSLHRISTMKVETGSSDAVWSWIVLHTVYILRIS